MPQRTFRTIVWLTVVVGLTLACQTATLVAKLRSTPTPIAQTYPSKSPTRRVPIARRVTRATEELTPLSLNFPPTEFDRIPTIAVSTPVIPIEPEPTEPPSSSPAPRPTRAVTTRPTQVAQAAAQLPPPTPAFRFQVIESRCGPNVRTFIEGTIIENGIPKNGLFVRISQGPDGAPDPNDDYHTGTDPRPGYYFENIDANAPHGGLWYLWVVDPKTHERISTIAIVKTDPKRVEDTDDSPGSCQSALVNFGDQKGAAVTFGGGTGALVIPTRGPTPTIDPNATPTPVGGLSTPTPWPTRNDDDGL